MKPLFIATAALAFALAGILGLNVEAAAQQTERVGNFAVTLRLPAEGLYADEESQIEFRIVDASKDDPVLSTRARTTRSLVRRVSSARPFRR